MIRKILAGGLLFLLFSVQLFGQDEPMSRIDTSGYVPGDLNYNLIVAAELGYDSEVLRLLNGGADINSKTAEGVSPLMYAAQNGQQRVVEILLLNGADPNLVPENGITALLGAVIQGYPAIAESLIRAGADLDQPDPVGVTPLMYACLYGDAEMADLLLYYGADPQKTDQEGNNALMLAVLARDPGTTGLLLQAGADVNDPDNEGYTPLMLAAQAGDTLLLSRLLDAGANIGQQNNAGATSLSLAISNGHAEAVKLLLDRGASPNESYPGNLTPISLSRSHGYDQVTGVLREAGARPAPFPMFGTLSLGISAGGNFTETVTGLSLGLTEELSGFRLEGGYARRPWAKRILLERNDSLSWQLWERRNYTWIGLYKEFGRKAGAGMHPFLGIKTLYTWGSYRGAETRPPALIRLVPAAGLTGGGNAISWRVWYEYMDLDIYRINPSRFMFELVFNMDLNRKTIRNKKPGWLND